MNANPKMTEESVDPQDVSAEAVPAEAVPAEAVPRTVNPQPAPRPTAPPQEQTVGSMAQPTWAPPAPAMPVGPPLQHKTPMLAALFSFVIPGLGQVYNGLYNRAMLTFGIFVGLFYVAVNTDGGRETALLVPALAFTFFFNVIDAYRQAKLVNYGGFEVEKQSAASKPGGHLAAGVALVVLGFLGLFQRLSGVEVGRLITEHWYLIALLAGGAMVAHAIVQRRRLADGHGFDDHSADELI